MSPKRTFEEIRAEIQGADARHLLAMLEGASPGDQQVRANQIAHYARDLSPALVEAIIPHFSTGVDVLARNPAADAAHLDLAFLLFAERIEREGGHMRAQSLSGKTPVQSLRDAVLTALRRAELCLESETLARLRAVGEKGMAPGWALASWAGRIERVREAGTDTPREVYRALLPEYIQEDWRDFGTDPGAQALLAHEDFPLSRLLWLAEEYNSPGWARSVAARAAEGKFSFAEMPEIRPYLRAHLRDPAVAEMLALSPDPEDFAPAMRSLWRDEKRRRRVLEDPRLPVEALGWLPRPYLMELLQDPSPETRLQAIRGATSSGSRGQNRA